MYKIQWIFLFSLLAGGTILLHAEDDTVLEMLLKWKNTNDRQIKRRLLEHSDELKHDLRGHRSQEVQSLKDLAPLLGSQFRNVIEIDHRAIAETNSLEYEALIWLSETQETDGHWDSKKFGADSSDDVATTALAILAFLSQDYTQNTGKFKSNVSHAITWSCESQKDGAFGNNVVDHCLASIAVMQDASATNNTQIMKSAQEALAYSCINIHSLTSEKGLFSCALLAMQLRYAEKYKLVFKDDIKHTLAACVLNYKTDNDHTFTLIRNGQPTAMASIFGLGSSFMLGIEYDLPKVADEICDYLEPASQDEFTLLIASLLMSSNRKRYSNELRDIRIAISNNATLTRESAYWKAEGRLAGAGRICRSALSIILISLCTKSNLLDLPQTIKNSYNFREQMTK